MTSEQTEPTNDRVGHTHTAADGAVFTVIDAPDEGRFHSFRNGQLVGYADYRVSGDTIIVPHVETVAAHRGNGYGAELMEGLLAIIAADGRTITPLCSFAAGHIRDNPDHHRLVAS